MGIRRIRDSHGMPIEDLKPGDDVHRAIKSLYEYGRSYPHGGNHDYPPAKAVPYPKQPRPARDDEPASYGVGRASPVSPAPDESGPQFRDEKVGDHNDVPVSDWTRSGTYPHFDSTAARLGKRK
jgi:hypothetical protein